MSYCDFVTPDYHKSWIMLSNFSISGIDIVFVIVFDRFVGCHYMMTLVLVRKLLQNVASRNCSMDLVYADIGASSFRWD